jgi:septal ring factor EnvC (AmiA/AmiB activator)
LVTEVYAEAVRQQQAMAPALDAEYRQLHQERQRKGEEINRLTTVLADTDAPLASVTQRLRETEEAVAQLDIRLAELKDRIVSIRSQSIDAGHLRDTLAKFDPIWDVLHPQERITIVHQIVESAVYEPDAESIRLTLRRSSA